MRFSVVASVLALALQANTIDAFGVSPTCLARSAPVAPLSRTTTFVSAMADSGAPPTESTESEVAEGDIPKNLPSDVGMDYVPLATMLATGQLLEADQVRFHRRTTILQ